MAGHPRRKRAEALTREQVLELLGQMADGQTLTAVCKAADLSYSAVRQRIVDYDLTAEYQRAREGFIDTRVEEMHAIADLEDDVQRARLKADITKWHASKVAPRQYGDKLQVEETVSLDDGQVMAKLAALIEAVRAGKS